MNAEHIKLIAAATNNEIADSRGVSPAIYCDSGPEWMVPAVETQDLLSDFIRASISYAECSKGKSGVIAGFKFIAFSRVQLRKGDRRRALSIIDFGDYREALDTDLSVF